jgi:DNA-binding HxlR family transcriptional regulator
MSPTHIDHTASACLATREVLDRVGDKWSLLVVFTLRDEPVRFNELKRKIAGISQRMLTLTLRGLERDGLIERTIYPTIPPRVDYALTPLGRSLIDPVTALAEWAQAHTGEINEARQRFDGTSTTAGAMKALLGLSRA